MIISSGYNVYPSQIENILDAHEYVQMSCGSACPDPYKMQKVKAFTSLGAGVPCDRGDQRGGQTIAANVAKYAAADIEVHGDMPKTLVAGGVSPAG